MVAGENYGVLLSNLRSNAGLSLETLARCVGSSKSALSRLENGDALQPFRGSVRKLVINLAELLCTSRRETERYLRLANIDVTLFTEVEEFQLGFGPRLDAKTSEEAATLQRWESIYQQLIQQLQECEARLNNEKVPPQFKIKRQEYMHILQEIQTKIKMPNEQKLGLKTKVGGSGAKPLPLLESNGCFSFGKLQTTWMVLDGDGTESYLPQHIRTFYDPHPGVIPEEIETIKKQIQEEQSENERDGKPFQWNGETYHLTRIVISRDPVHEQMKVSLWYKPTDYYTLLAKNKCMEDPYFREKYIQGRDWEDVLPLIPTISGSVLTLLTSDGYTLFTQRGKNVGVLPGIFHTSIGEGFNRPLDKSTTSQAPDFYRCACRGLFEELGLQENIDFVSSDIHFLSLGLDTQYITCGLRGIVRVQKSANEIIKNWQAGVKDKMENKHLFAAPFTPQDVCDFVFSREPWAPGGLICLYHALIHEFGREEVERVVSSY